MKRIDKVAEFDLNEVIKQDSFLTEATQSGLLLSVATMQRRVNQLIEETERLQACLSPYTDLDNPENNCKKCDHVHEKCKCGCQSE